MRYRIGFVLAVTACLLAVPARAAVPVPEVIGPIAAPDAPGSPSHNYVFFASNHDLTSRGYMEEEYFVKGTAATYKTGGTETGEVASTGQIFYTRVVVRRPINPKRFNGTAIVEWTSDSNNFHAENVWFFGWHDMMRSGYAWVGVSPMTRGTNALKKWNPQRYGALSVGQAAEGGGPGAPDVDAASFDIISQVAQALKTPGTVGLLGGLKPKVVLATGESQSAGRLVTYVNNIHPLVKVYDGFLLLTVNTPIRSDPISPVFRVQTEYDVLAGGAANWQPDSDKYREWDVAGSSHVDQVLRNSREPLEIRDLGSAVEATLAPQCLIPQLGTRTAKSQVVAAAFAHMARWAAGGKAPPIAPKLDLTQVNKPPVMSVARRNEFQLAQGGIQLASQVVPTQINHAVGVPRAAAGAGGGEGGNSGGGCRLWGATEDMTVVQLKTLYPTHADYVAKVRKVTRDNVAKGFLLQVDGDDLVRAAELSAIGDW
ncbi:MAG TPA: alpha/beta hydrolase domain-containing protein [Rhizomicrobium sp.]|nr:alpha/beta hydrolase domain-containing protein [Rhizomicrobium sp.]